MHDKNACDCVIYYHEIYTLQRFGLCIIPFKDQLIENLLQYEIMFHIFFINLLFVFVTFCL